MGFKRAMDLRTPHRTSLCILMTQMTTKQTDQLFPNAFFAKLQIIYV